jgi:hypothetical protein
MLAYSRRRGTWKKFSLGAIEAVSGKHIVADSNRDSDTQAGRIEIFDAIVADAGVPGLYQLYRLREQGLKQRCVQDAAVLAARGIGIAIPAGASTRRAKPTAVRSLKKLLRERE